MWRCFHSHNTKYQIPRSKARRRAASRQIPTPKGWDLSNPKTRLACWVLAAYPKVANPIAQIPSRSSAFGFGPISQIPNPKPQNAVAVLRFGCISQSGKSHSPNPKIFVRGWDQANPNIFPLIPRDQIPSWHLVSPSLVSFVPIASVWPT